MHHSGTEQLEPSLESAGATTVSLAHGAGHVDLGAGLGEREVRGPESQLTVGAKVGTAEGVQGPLEIRQGNVGIDHQSLDLKELNAMSGVFGLVSIAATGDDHTHRRP